MSSKRRLPAQSCTKLPEAYPERPEPRINIKEPLHLCDCILYTSYDPKDPQPVHWLRFLSDLLYPEDIPTVQEFIGYCLIPSNKGQRMMVIKGSGGEGKSQIGVVLSRLFGCHMKDGSIGKISENRFARADLEHTLLCVDDDMRMEALRQTNYVKSIVTAQGQDVYKRQDGITATLYPAGQQRVIC